MRPWRSVRLAPLILTLTALTAMTIGGTASVLGKSSGSTAVKTHHALNTVFLIVMENHNWSVIAGSDAAPYINKTLIPLASHATQYYNPPGNHPSLPNYLWLESGTNFGIADDNNPSGHVLTTKRHLVALMDRAHLPWRAYEEDISGTTCPTSDSDL